MSDNKPVAIMPKLNDELEPVIPGTDFSIEDNKKLAKYKEDGMPGISRIGEDDYNKLCSLYLDGLTYHDLSRITRLPKIAIMATSERFKWFEARMGLMQELQEKAMFRTVEAKLKAQDFLFTMSTAFQKKIGRHLDRYLGENDEASIEKVDKDDVMQFLKIIDSLEKISDPTRGRQSGPAPSTIGLNMGQDGVTVTKTGPNSVEITPKNKTHSDMLKDFADARRQEEAQKASDTKKKKE